MLKALGWEISQFNNPGQITFRWCGRALAVLAVLFIASALIGLFWLGMRWVAAAAIFWAIALLFYTTFFTNGQGIGTGIIGSLGYWIDQQEVMRGGQPWYYFYMLVPLYEFLPLVLFIGGLVGVDLCHWKETGGQDPSRARRRWTRGQTATRRTVFENRSPVAAACRRVDLPPAISVQARLRGLHRLLAARHLGGVHLRWREDGVAHRLLRHFDGAAGRLVARQGLQRDQLEDGRKRGIFWLMAMIPLFLIALKAMLPTSTRRPFPT